MQRKATQENSDGESDERTGAEEEPREMQAATSSATSDGESDRPGRREGVPAISGPVFEFLQQKFKESHGMGRLAGYQQAIQIFPAETRPRSARQWDYHWHKLAAPNNDIINEAEALNRLERSQLEGDSFIAKVVGLRSNLDDMFNCRQGKYDSVPTVILNHPKIAQIMAYLASTGGLQMSVDRTYNVGKFYCTFIGE